MTAKGGGNALQRRGGQPQGGGEGGGGKGRVSYTPAATHDDHAGGEKKKVCAAPTSLPSADAANEGGAVRLAAAGWGLASSAAGLVESPRQQ